MGCVSAKPNAISAETHRFVAQTVNGNVTRMAVSYSREDGRTSSVLPSISESFFGIDVAYNDIQLTVVIGSGSFGDVYEAMYKGFSIAVKAIRVPEDPEKLKNMLNAFDKEVCILSHLRHPSIVQDPHYCLITELCEGSVLDLLRLAEANTYQVTWNLVVAIASDCAKAVTYLHNLSPSIIHRDLKAENILITKRFKGKLSDFGLSREVRQEDEARTLCGTPRWVAPEIFRGDPYTKKVDTYSFGIVLWELFCFHKPYADKEILNLPYLIAYQDLRPPLSEHIPEALQEIMTNCWHPNPDNRPTFEEIVEILEIVKRKIRLDIIVDPKKSYDESVTIKLKSDKSYGMTSGAL